MLTLEEATRKYFLFKNAVQRLKFLRSVIIYKEYPNSCKYDHNKSAKCWEEENYQPEYNYMWSGKKVCPKCRRTIFISNRIQRYQRKIANMANVLRGYTNTRYKYEKEMSILEKHSDYKNPADDLSFNEPF